MEDLVPDVIPEEKKGLDPPNDDYYEEEDEYDDRMLQPFLLITHAAYN